MSGELNLFSDEIRRRERARRRKDLLWSVVSFFVHGALFTAIILLTPAKKLILPEEKKAEANPAADLSADRIEEIAESLSEARINELMDQIEAMQAVLHNMDVMKEELAKDYDAFAEKCAEDVRTELDRLVAETAEEQRKAVEAQAAVKADVAELVRLETTADLRDKAVANELRAKANTLRDTSAEKTLVAQANAVNALDRLQVRAEFAGYRKTAEAAEKVRDAQMEAGRMQDEAQGESAKTAEDLSRVADATARVERLEKTIVEQKDRIERNAELVKESAKKAAEEKTLAEAAEKRRDQLRAEKKWEESKAENKVASDHRSEQRKAEAEERRAEREVASAKGAVERAEKELPEALRQESELKREKAEKTGEKQLAKLDRSASAQEAINAKLELLKATLAADASVREPQAQGEKREENRLVREDVSRRTMTEAYALAKELESAIVESYKDIKATQTAITRKMSVEAAQKITDVAKPERLEADSEAIESTPRTKAALDRQKAAEAEVVREADSMVEATVAMMNEAVEIVMSGDSSSPQLASKEKPRNVKWMEEKDLESRDSAEAQEARLAAMTSEADYQVELESAAAEDASAKAKDLAELMAQADAEAMAEAEAERARAKAEKEGENGAVDKEGAKGEMIGALPGPPELKGGDLALLPGNVMNVAGTAADALPGEWMYVNSWYVIGPFPNPNRINLRRKFAPESVVDLDATYVGKDGRILRWEFCQAVNVNQKNVWGGELKNAAEVVPKSGEEYSIFYAYAEVFFDQACDRWVAIGSDDRSDVWLNDIKIWGSSNKLKAWTLAEDFRRVHFKKGRNRILARIENGHWYFGWSLCISVADAGSGR